MLQLLEADMSTGPTKPHVLVIQPFGHLFPRTRRIIFHLSAWPRNLKKKKILGRKKKKVKDWFMKKEKNLNGEVKILHVPWNLYQTKYDYILHVFMIRKHERRGIIHIFGNETVSKIRQNTAWETHPSQPELLWKWITEKCKCGFFLKK